MAVGFQGRYGAECCEKGAPGCPARCIECVLTLAMTWIQDACPQLLVVHTQMTKAHVGSLLVFDPSKMELSEDEKPDMDKTKREAVVGIVTERGSQPCCLTDNTVFSLDSSLRKLTRVHTFTVLLIGLLT